MIARDGSEPPLSDPSSRTIAHGWLYWWRQVVTRAIHIIRSTARSAVAVAQTAVSRGRRYIDSGAFSDVRHPALGWAGASAVVLGAVVGVAIAPPGIERQTAALAGAASLMWMVIRWLGMRLAAPRLFTEDRAALRGALALGLLSYSLAVTPELRLVAWFAAAVVTAWALLRVGRQRREVLLAVGFAWGMQALVVAGGWLARNALVALLAARG